MASDRVERLRELLGLLNAGDLDAFFDELADAVLVQARWHLTAAATGQPIPVEDFFLVVWFEGDRPRRSAAFFDERRAREVAGAAPG